MHPNCPHCQADDLTRSEFRVVTRKGTYLRDSDRALIQRYKCSLCRRTFSDASFDPRYRQTKRHLNSEIFIDICSATTLRRTAWKLAISRNTVAAKIGFLAKRARLLHAQMCAHEPKAQVVEFDDLETFEHTKLKPLTLTLAVTSHERRFLAASLASMPPKGPAAERALKKYGPRKDTRKAGRRKLFQELQTCVEPNAVIESDMHPHYPPDVREFFPRALHLTYHSREARDHGHGELKVGPSDPLAGVNHTSASLRANLSCLVRQTWATTKKAERLEDRVALYMIFHNLYLRGEKNAGETQQKNGPGKQCRPGPQSPNPSD